MERAVVVGALGTGPTVCAAVPDCDRVYFGPEFCAELLPTGAELRVALDAAAAAGVALTLVTPPVSQQQLERVVRLCDLLPTGSEVVVNDFGVLHALRNRDDLVLVAGRVFSRGRRDPRLLRVWDRLPRARTDRYETLEVLEAGLLDLLVGCAVARVELSPRPWPTEALPAGLPVALSWHDGYTWVTTSRRCPLVRVRGDGRPGRPCTRPCAGQVLRLVNGAMPDEMLLVGNAYHYPAAPTALEALPAAVDRLVSVSSVAELGGVPGG